MRASLLYELERWEQARSLLAPVVAGKPVTHPGPHAMYAELLARDGDRAGAESIAAALAGLPAPDANTRQGIGLARARIAAALGDRDGAVTLLRDVTRRGFPSTPGRGYMLHTDPALASLRSYAPARALLGPNR